MASLRACFSPSVCFPVSLTHPGTYPFPLWDSEGEESACSAGDLGWSLSWEGPLEKEMATHFQYS